jgi:DNA-directed RNA polymerase specialized sigma24 family protein
MSAIPESEDRLTKAEVEATLAAFQPADWQRTKIIASILCAGVTGWTADDLMQEAMCKLLGRERVWPRSIHPLVVLKTVMHSIASNTRKHNEASPIDANVVVDPFEADVDDITPVAHGKMTVTPEHETSGKQQIAALYAALGGDEDMELLVVVWVDGVRGSEARKELGWDEKKYDAVRNRLLRRLAALDPDRRKS